MRIFSRLLGSLFIYVAMALPASAVSIYGDAADLTGTRGTPGANGMTGNSNWSTDFTVSWEITDNLDGTLHYKYTFTGFGDSDKDISNFVLDISDNCDVDPNCVTNPLFTAEGIPQQPITDIEFGDFNGVTGAIKFDVGTDGTGSAAIYEFDSNRSAVWGHIAMKDGVGSGTCATPMGSWGDTVLACSNALLGIGDDSDAINYIARPNGMITMPVPAAVWLFGSALGLLAWVRRRS